MDAVLGKASVLMSQSQYQEAAAALQPLSENNCDPRVSLLLAAASEGEGDTVKATTVLQQAHAAWPANNSIAASLARQYLAAKDVNRATNALSHFHATAETSEQEMQMAAVVYLAAHQLVQAQTIAEASYKFHPSARTLLLLANILQMQGRYPDVDRLLQAQRKTYADSPEFFVTLAESEFDASDYAEARQDLQRAIALDAASYQAHYLLGNVLFRSHDTDGAIAEYRKAIELAPSQPRAYFQLALALRSKQDQAGEQDMLQQALTADEHYAPAQCEIGGLLLDDHHPADAVSHLTAAIDDNPRYEKSYYLLAKAYAQLGEKDKSEQIVQRLLAIRDKNRPGPGDKNENHFDLNQSTSP